MTRPKDQELIVTFSNFSDPVACLNLVMDFVSKTNLVATGILNFKRIIIPEIRADLARSSNFVYLNQ